MLRATEETLTHAPHQFLCVPVKDIVVGVAEFVEEVPEELSQERVVWPVLKLERPTEVEVSRKLTYRATHTHTHTHTQAGVGKNESSVSFSPRTKVVAVRAYSVL